VKILAVSGSKSADELLSEAQHCGADAMLPKPVGIDELRAAVALSLEGRRGHATP
jgi:DNA-binding NarL/FixJ family response regulator